MAKSPLRILTRRSRLALIQASRVQEMLARLGSPSILVPLSSMGDKKKRKILWNLGESEKGLFTRFLTEQLLEGEGDLAVHSLKDIPTETGLKGLDLIYLRREDPHDFLWTKKKRPRRIGTGSPRRIALGEVFFKNCEFVPVRGNVPTRISLCGKKVDGVILSVAGLRRLRLPLYGKCLSLRDFPPAPGQGVIAVEYLKKRRGLASLLSKCEDPLTRKLAKLEREVVRTLRLGCQSRFGLALLAKGPKVFYYGALSLAPFNGELFQLLPKEYTRRKNMLYFSGSVPLSRVEQKIKELKKILKKMMRAAP